MPLYTEKIDEPTVMYARSFLGVPIIVRNECIGFIRLVSKKSDIIFTEADEELLSDIASVLAPAILSGDSSYVR